MPDATDIQVVRSEKLSAFRAVVCGCSVRLGGVSRPPLGMNLSFNVGDVRDNVIENRKRFFGTLGLKSAGVAFTRQCHSATVKTVVLPGEYDACDGLITSTSNLPLAISVADCLPVLLFDPDRHVIAAVHAGWRGSASHIIKQAVKKLQAEFRSASASLIAFLGPAAGACCYEVGQEVADRFDADVLAIRFGRIFLDLKKENARQLLDLGVDEKNIETSQFCTICTPSLFHSYRRDGKQSGRMMGVICLIDEEN